jgi:4-amino-4-deoxychorismate lyase
MTTFCSIDGNPLTTDSTIDNLINDRGLAYGHGLFETVLYRRGELPLLDRHLARICRDALKLGISVQLKEVISPLNQFIAQLQANSVTEGVIKIIITAGNGARGYASPVNLKPKIMCIHSPGRINQMRSSRGMRVRCCEYRLPTNYFLAGLKHLNRLDQILARAEWNSSDFDEGLLFDDENNLIEAISANIFIRTNDGHWLTPDLTKSGVNGVMRSLLLETLYPNCCIPVKVTQINSEQLKSCVEMFACNSIRGIVPITSIFTSDNQLLKEIPIGEHSLMLQGQLEKRHTHYR